MREPGAEAEARPDDPEPRPRARFVGRSTELDQILAAAREAADGHPRLVSIEGAPGLGKSALVRRALEVIGPDATVVRLQGDDLAVTVPMALVSQLVDAAGLPPFSVGILLVERLAELQQRGPVVLVVEDLHWADEPSRQAIVTALRRLDQDRVLVLVTLRDDELARDERWERVRLDPERSLRITLPPFGAADATDLAASLGIVLDREAAQRIVDHAGGNPLYVQTLLSEVPARQLTEPGGPLPIPKSLASLVLAQVGACGPAQIALIEALAVLGGRAATGTLEAVAGVDRAVDQLRGPLVASLVEIVDAAPSTTISFAHPLFRSAVYSDLGQRRRQELHAAAARALGGDDALRHRVAAGDPSDGALVADLRAASAAARHGGKGARAAQYLLDEAELTASDREKEDLRLDAARLYLEAGQRSEALALVRGADGTNPSPRRDLVAGVIAAQSGDIERGERLLRSASASDDTALAAAALVQLGWLLTTQTRGGEAVAVLAPVPRLVDPEAPDAQVSAVLRAIGVSQQHGAVQGLAELASAFPTDRWRPDAIDALVVGTRGMLAVYAGRYGEAEQALRAFIAAAQRGLQTFHLPRVEALLAQTLVARGGWDEAVAHAHIAVDLVEGDGDALVRAQAHASAALVHAARGERDRADEHAEAARAAASVAATAEADVWARRAAASSARARGDHEQVVHVLAPLERGRDDDGLPVFAAWWLPRLIDALIETGRLDDAAERIELLDRLQARRSVDLGAVTALHRARIEAERRPRPSQEGLAGFERAAAAITPDTPVLDQADIHWRHGRVLAATGSPSEARRRFLDAERLLAGLQAGPYLEAVRSDLATDGAAPSPTGPTPIPGADQLTERERDVVALVQQGYTNREAAAALFVSTKAVEYHMTNILAKLGIRSRRELLRRPTT